MLTDKEERFCQEYLIDLNATQAAIRAGYSERSAKEIGYENLTKPHVQYRISALKNERSIRTQITADRVLKEFASIGFANIQDFLNSDLSMRNIKLLKRKQSAAIASIKKTTFESESGVKTQVEFKLHDKVKALEDIAKHIGFFEIDNKQKALNAEQVNIYQLPDNNRDDRTSEEV